MSTFFTVLFIILPLLLFIIYYRRYKPRVLTHIKRCKARRHIRRRFSLEFSRATNKTRTHTLLNWVVPLTCFFSSHHMYTPRRIIRALTGKFQYYLSAVVVDDDDDVIYRGGGVRTTRASSRLSRQSAP